MHPRRPEILPKGEEVITIEQLQRIMPHAGKRAAVFIEPLNAAMNEFGITTPKRQAAFIAQIAHESGSFRYVRELASGEAYDTGRLAARLGNTPEADGDGQRYRGRGLIQITGHDNYLRCGLALDVDLLAEPELLEQPVLACRSAAWFWWAHELNELADRCEFQRITKRINGGLNGQADRLAFYTTALRVLG
jgi:putative chitinase